MLIYKRAAETNAWSIPKFDRLAGVAELLEAIRSYSNWSGRGFPHENLPDSLQRLCVLVELAYHTSISPEEGNFPVLRILVPDLNLNTNFNRRVEFNAKLSNDAAGVATLKRIAPAAGSMSQMVVVEDHDGEWMCTGFASAEPNYSPSVGPWHSWHMLYPQQPFGISIRIDGPATLQVNLDGIHFRLEGGRVYDTVPLMHLPRIRDVVIDIGDNLTKDLGVRKTETSDGRATQIDIPVHFALEQIVSQMQAAKRGGTLVFPGEGSERFIDAKYLAQGPGLGHALRSYYFACKECSGAENVTDLTRGIASWQSATTAIFRLTEAIALMSRVDGCLVLGRNFEVDSFGSKLVTGRTIDGLRRTAVFSDREIDSDADVRALGTRNQSAFDFCRTVPGSVAIVVSQDGQVRVAGSNSDSVQFADLVSASSIQNPSW